MPVKVRVFVPSLVKVPVPLISPLIVWSNVLLKIKAALLTMAPVPKKPNVVPEPICKVPAVMVVVPE